MPDIRLRQQDVASPDLSVERDASEHDVWVRQAFSAVPDVNVYRTEVFRTRFGDATYEVEPVIVIRGFRSLALLGLGIAAAAFTPGGGGFVVIVGAPFSLAGSRGLAG